MNELEIYCPNRPKGCKSIILYGAAKTHLNEECQFQKIPCTNQKLGCQEMVFRCELQKHINENCAYIMKCEQCAGKVFVEKDQHALCLRQMMEELSKVQHDLTNTELKLGMVRAKNEEYEKIIQNDPFKDIPEEKIDESELEKILGNSKVSKSEKLKDKKDFKTFMQCKTCGRIFKWNVIEKHEEFCIKQQHALPRPKFNSAKQRLAELALQN